jgi:hypothetical protein
LIFFFFFQIFWPDVYLNGGRFKKKLFLSFFFLNSLRPIEYIRVPIVRERPKNKKVDLYTHNNREWLKKNHDREQKKKPFLFCGLLLLLWAGLRDWFDPISPPPPPSSPRTYYFSSDFPSRLSFCFPSFVSNWMTRKKEKEKRKRKE